MEDNEIHWEKFIDALRQEAIKKFNCDFELNDQEKKKFKSFFYFLQENENFPYSYQYLNIKLLEFMNNCRYTHYFIVKLVEKLINYEDVDYKKTLFTINNKIILEYCNSKIHYKKKQILLDKESLILKIECDGFNRIYEINKNNIENDLDKILKECEI